jgi:hypothetical protein
MRIVVDLVGLCYLVCGNSLADFLPLVLEPSMGLGSGLLEISHLAGRDPDRAQTNLYDEGKTPYQWYR